MDKRVNNIIKGTNYILEFIIILLNIIKVSD